MTTAKKGVVLRKFLSQKVIVSILFAIILISGASGNIPLRMSSRQQVAYAQEDSDFGSFTDESVPVQEETNTFPDDSVPPETGTTAQGEICDDLIDDDGDGFADADDPEGCITLGSRDLVREMRAPDCPVESQPIEICNNFVDDDGDGLVDEDCATGGGLRTHSTPKY